MYFLQQYVTFYPVGPGGLSWAQLRYVVGGLNGKKRLLYMASRFPFESSTWSSRWELIGTIVIFNLEVVTFFCLICFFFRVLHHYSFLDNYKELLQRVSKIIWHHFVLWVIPVASWYGSSFPPHKNEINKIRISLVSVKLKHHKWSFYNTSSF